MKSFGNKVSLTIKTMQADRERRGRLQENKNWKSKCTELRRKRKSKIHSQIKASIKKDDMLVWM